MAVKRVIKRVHIVPMGMANAFLIDRSRRKNLISVNNPDELLILEVRYNAHELVWIASPSFDIYQTIFI